MIGKFITKVSIIQALIVLLYELTIDKLGLTHYGFTGDWKIYDLSGFVYYMRDYLFRLKYVPFDMLSFKLILTDNRLKQDKINRVIILSN